MNQLMMLFYLTEDDIFFFIALDVNASGMQEKPQTVMRVSERLWLN